MEKKSAIYFKYAIGEIILVVIGILIALQINNWSEQTKNRDFELKMLNEVKKGLTNDINFLKTNTLYRYGVLDSVLEIAVQYVKDKKTFNDSLYATGFASRLEFGAAISFNRGPYEAVKSAGIDRIINDSLRNKLINYYDFELPFWEILIREYSDQYEEDLKLLTSLRLEPEIYTNREEVYVIRLYPKNLFQTSGFKQFLWQSKRRATGTRNMTNLFIPKMESVLELINEEISKN
jgi:hypothetical protein